jgi:hypothetical protein
VSENGEPRKFVVTGCARSATTYTAELLSAAGIPCGHEYIFDPWLIATPGEDPFVESPELRGDAAWEAVGFFGVLPQGTVVLHQVREPVNVVRSLLGVRLFADDYHPTSFDWRRPNAPDPIVEQARGTEREAAAIELHNRVAPLFGSLHRDYQNFVRKVCPAIFADDDETLRAMRYWTLWNLMAEDAQNIDGLRYFRFRIEDLGPELLRDIAELVGAPLDDQALDGALATVDRATNAGARVEEIDWESLPAGPDADAVKELAARYGYETR